MYAVKRKMLRRFPWRQLEGMVFDELSLELGRLLSGNSWRR
jgi:hypothetical protein